MWRWGDGGKGCWVMRFKVSHLLMALTLAAIAAVVLRQVLVVRPPSRDEMGVAILLTGGTALAIGVALGYLLRGGGGPVSQRRRLLPFVVAASLVNGMAYGVQGESLKLLRHADYGVPPIIAWFIYFDDIWLFAALTLGVVAILVFGVALRHEKLIRWIAAVSLGFWMLVFMGGYLGAASSSVYVGPPP